MVYRIYLLLEFTDHNNCTYSYDYKYGYYPSDEGDLMRSLLSCLGHVLFLLTKTFILFYFTICKILTYQIKKFFQKRVVRTKLDICDIFISFLLRCVKEANNL